jgi:type VI secretion system protein ImpE
VTHIKESFDSGDLQGAIEQQLSVVKSNPMDGDQRFFLAELFALDGAWERADRQLDTILQQAKGAAVYPLLFRQLLRAELIRREVLLEGRAPELVTAKDDSIEVQLRLGLADRSGEQQEVPVLLERLGALSDMVSGECDGETFRGLIDADLRLGLVAEVLSATGRYFWIPWARFRSIEFAPAERPLDLIWRKASVDIDGGPGGDVYMPVRYVINEQWNDEAKLGRSTQWSDGMPEIPRGVGQRLLLVGDEDKSILEISRIEIRAN